MCPLRDEFGIAADLDEPGGVAGVDDEQADFLVIEQVAAFLPVKGCVHQCALAVQVDPYQARLWLAVITQRCEHAADGPGQQVVVRGGYRKSLGRDGTGALSFLPAGSTGPCRVECDGVDWPDPA